MGKFLSVAAFWLMGLTLQVAAVEIVAGPEVQVTGTTARIQWSTDAECGTRARYGLSPDQLTNKAEGGVATVHEVKLTSLQPGTVYHYNVGTARYVLKTGSFTTGPATGKPAPPAQVKPTAGATSAASKPRPLAPVTTPPPVKRTAPPARQTWANPYSLGDHFERHGRDFHATSADDYARQAWEFFQRAMDEGLPAKYDDSDGTFRVYDPKTGAFAAYNQRGKTRTYFKPGNPDYFQRQPGKPVKVTR